MNDEKEKIEVRPLSYDGSVKHPRYHYCDPPFKYDNEWFWSLILMLVIIFIPLIWIANKIEDIKEK